MARPRSDDKRKAILAAATQVVAEQGIGAPTAKIAKLAGVAEGSLFTYFSNKDELINQLYVELKSELGELMMVGYPKRAATKAKVKHAWQRYVDWGVAHPAKRKAMAQLAVSDRISEQTRAVMMRSFAEMNELLGDTLAHGPLRGCPDNFVGALMGAMAETTMEFMSREPKSAERYADAGFEAFWNAVAKA
ncbi:MAG: TetR/AcrR family transcriptional regulator [Solimonas sp.]